MLHRSAVLRLPRAALARRDVVARSLRGADAALFHAFAFKDDELAFARALAERTQLWIWRVDQRSFAGDFVVVDVSSPSIARRRAVVVELKRGARLRVGRTGIQMRHAHRALADIAALGVIESGCEVAYVTGDARSVLAELAYNAPRSLRSVVEFSRPCRRLSGAPRA